MKDKVIAVANQRGGLGKTTTALALAAAYSFTGDRVLAIDMDPQCNFTDTLGADRTQAGVQQFLYGQVSWQVIQKISPNLHVIPASKTLGSAELNLVRNSHREYTLKLALQSILANYDRIIIDTRPALGMLSINALVAADTAIVPAMPEKYSLEGVIDLADTIRVIQRQANPELYIMGIVLTRYKGRADLAKEVAEVLETAAAQLNTKVFNTRIRESDPISESQTYGQDIFTYSRRSAGAKDYAALFAEITGRDLFSAIKNKSKQIKGNDDGKEGL